MKDSGLPNEYSHDEVPLSEDIRSRPKVKPFKKLSIVIAVIASVSILLCVFAQFLKQTPLIVLELPNILTVREGNPGSEHVQWIVIPKITMKPSALGVGIMHRGKIEIKHPTLEITSLPIKATNVVDLLTLLNPPPAELPPIYRDLVPLLVPKPTTGHVSELQNCQFRITLDAFGGPPSLWRKIGDISIKLGIWNPSRGLPIDDLFRRLTRITDHYPISSKWSQPKFIEYQVGNSLQVEMETPHKGPIDR